MRGSLGATALWCRRLRRKPFQTALSVCGVAVGVALAYAVAAANSTMTAGYDRLQRDLAGRAQVELLAQGPRGVHQSVVARASRVPGVMAAAPLTEHEVRLRQGGRVADVRLLGADARLRGVGGRLARMLPAAADERALGLHLPARLARALGARPGSRVGVESSGRTADVQVAQVLSRRKTGPLGQAAAAAAPLAVTQEVAGEPGQVHRVLVRLRSDTPDARNRLRLAVGPGVLVRGVGDDVRLIEQATGLPRRAASLFAALSLVIGGLLAYSAMVLSLAQQRREVATLRVLGCGMGALVAAALAQALVIGGIGTVVGVLAGRLAVAQILEPGTAQLASAFFLPPLSTVPVGVVAMSCLMGLLTSVAAAALPTRALARVPPADAFQREPETAAALTGARGARLAIVAAALSIGGLVAALVGSSLLGIAAWVAGGTILVPIVVPAAARAVRRVSFGRSCAPDVGVAEVGAFPARAAAIAWVVAAAVAGMVLIGGAVTDLERGTARLAASTFHRGDLWVTAPGRDNVYLTRQFDAAVARRVARLPFVRDVAPLRARFLDWGGRRVYAFGFDFRRGRSLAPAETVRGDPRLLAASAPAVALSDELAQARGLAIGDTFALATPTGPRRARLVATTTNYGWQPGAVAMNAALFARWWGSHDVGGLALRLEPGTSAPLAARRLRAALLPTGLEVAPPAQLRARVEAAAYSGLAVLRRIVLLLAIAGVLAVVAASVAGVLQRLHRITALRALGMTVPQLASVLLAETGLVLGVGLAVGLPVGLVGHGLAVHNLTAATSYPASFGPSAGPILTAFASLASIAAAATLVSLIQVLRRGRPGGLSHA